MDSKDLTIGVLSTTAVVLFVGLMLVQSTPAPVYASGMGDTGGDYIMLSGELFNQEELLYVIDTAQDKMLTYRFDMANTKIIRAGGELFENYFNVRPPKAKNKKKKGRGRRHP